eukprot:166733-Pelagomonas_calceolata.AAC.1
MPAAGVLPAACTVHKAAALVAHLSLAWLWIAPDDCLTFWTHSLPPLLPHSSPSAAHYAMPAAPYP